MNDPVENATWVYTYDRGGNILNKKKYAYTTGTVGAVQQTITYTYDGTWKDKLTGYNGTALTYDAMGNLTNDGTWAYTWICGRQLRRMYDGTTDIYYGYDHNGLRVSKNVNGTVTNYTTTNGKLTHMKRGSEYMHIFYDGQGRASLFNKNGVKYTYVYNLQGDVVGLLDESGALVVEYKYDAWGKLLGTTGNLASTIGKFNPLRYRGYVYDEETGLYYLKSRYYNPEWGRFVNADVLLGKRGALLSHNLFAYCYNNYVKQADYNGYAPGDLFDSMDEAAKDFAYCMNPISIQEKAEYAAIIYEEETGEVITKRFLLWTWSEPVVKYTYTQPIKGEATSIDPKQDPMFEEGEAVVHTHGAFKYKGDNCENFSGDDKKFARHYGLVLYVATPNGILRRYEKRWEEMETVVCDDIPYDPNYPFG